MAKMGVTYRCGHEGCENIGGPYKGRASKIEWIENNKLCPDCYRAEKERERAETRTKRDAENAESAKANAAGGRPELKGSEKQIAWAETIRKPILDDFEARKDRILAATKPEFIAQMRLVFSEIESEQSAKWWIDNREKNLKRIVNDKLRPLLANN